MTTLASVSTIRDVLWPDAELRSPEVLRKAINDHQIVEGRIKPPVNAVHVIQSELAKSADQILATDLIDIGVSGWRKYNKVTAAAHRTYSAQSTEVLAMCTHRITLTQRPVIEIYLDGICVGTVAIELTGFLELCGLQLVIAEAHLTEIRCGECTADLRLSIEGFPVAHRRQRFDVRGNLPLRRPVLLIRRSGAPVRERSLRPPR
ncbi:hypothetical protein [Gordonia aquimaris]|uniref:Uncharacterized protein n=1 Tax=Gordonia aquimaris TaxID=2984863 RepID=A0A9X3I340_9ACTN|nr:hypothetical protein [Gordonia aquimaris]MCX2963178.1 hypothetical protein [Gordonia aquimaris]